MTESYSRADWKRLGTAVQAARLRHNGWKDIQEWALAVGRSTRILQGLERGEPAGAKTLREVEATLQWPPGHTDKILADATADLAPDKIRPSAERLLLPDERTPLDRFTTHELLEEIEARYTDLAMELQNLGYTSMNERWVGVEHQLTVMSPQDRREHGHSAKREQFELAAAHGRVQQAPDAVDQAVAGEGSQDDGDDSPR